MTTDVVKQIRRATRRRFTAEEKIHIVLGFEPQYSQITAGLGVHRSCADPKPRVSFRSIALRVYAEARNGRP